MCSTKLANKVQRFWLCNIYTKYSAKHAASWIIPEGIIFNDTEVGYDLPPSITVLKNKQASFHLVWYCSPGSGFSENEGCTFWLIKLETIIITNNVSTCSWQCVLWIAQTFWKKTPQWIEMFCTRFSLFFP